MTRSLAMLACAALAAQAADEKPYDPGKIRADEPSLKTASLERAAKYLDHAAAGWTKRRRCATCHTNVPYLMARPSLGEASAEAKAVRAFFEGRAKNWDRGQKGDKPDAVAEVVAVAAALAFNDAGTTGKLHPLTRSALDRMWTMQQKDGAWNWTKCGWPPLEHDDYHGAVLAAVGAGIAPDGYAGTPKAKAGLDRLRAYFKATPAPNLHHKAWLLWASTRLDGLMDKAEREKTIKEIRAAQRADGGWSLASLGDWKGFDGRANDPKAASDGYGTGLLVYVLRQAGVPASDAGVKKGAAWLRANQRVSGRWFTKSLNTDSNHFISNAGTAFAVLALKACG